MAVGVSRYSRSILPFELWDALETANTLLIDFCFEALRDLARGRSVLDSEIVGYLPPRYLPKYNETFFRKFLLCLGSVGLKLRLRGTHPLGSMAEALALHAMEQLAVAVLEWAADEAGTDVPSLVREAQAAFGRWDDYAFDDPDHELLFDDSSDGIEDSVRGQELGIRNARFGEWFLPWDDRVVSPYF